VTIAVYHNGSGSPSASDVDVNQNATNVYSILGANTHDIQAISRFLPATISFPPGGNN
ncbi:MAG: hypothetical protein HRU15_11900, partial [Planctomycetes bacterium]|nr:hypothetical protein [Planctomycetota bacterium]